MRKKNTNTLIYKKDIIIPVCIVAAMWMIYFFQTLGVLSDCYGVVSWSFTGLRGVLFSPFLHGSFNHLWSNTVGLLPLLIITFIFYRRYAFKVLIYGSLLSGLILWVMPSLSYFKTGVALCHIGASGVIYMLVSFLFFGGWFSGKFLSLILSVVIALVYYTLLMGVFPNDTLADNISWQGHLSGVIAGFILAKGLGKDTKVAH